MITFHGKTLVNFLGFQKNQAELIVSALVTLTTSNMDIVYKDMVTSAHQVGFEGAHAPRV